MEVVGGVASVIAVVELSGKIVRLCGDYASSVKNAKKDMETLQQEVAFIKSVFDEVFTLGLWSRGGNGTSQAAITDVENRAKECVEKLEFLHKTLIQKRGGGRRERLGRALEWAFKSKDVKKVIKVLQHQRESLSAFLIVQNTKKSEFFEEEKLLKRLPKATEAAFDSQSNQHQPFCLPGTRVDLLQKIYTWCEDTDGACVYWLRGVAGTGKSTIAHTVARTWKNRQQLGASFFFSRGKGDCGNAAKFVTTIVRQLVEVLHSLRPCICRTISEDPSIAERSLGEQWKRFIVQPFSDIQKTSPDPRLLTVVIDALDECDGDDDVRLILRLLAQAAAFSSSVVRLRIFITSRPETPIRLGFQKIVDIHREFVLHDIPPPIIKNDISVFFRHELEDIREEKKLPKGWPDENTIDRLSNLASGLFIYASTACRFIRDPNSDPSKSLLMILKDKYIGQYESQEDRLDEMYTQVLKRSIIPDGHRKERLNQELKRIIGSIVILFDPLPADEIDELLDMERGTTYRRLHSLYSVLDVPENNQQSPGPVRLLHLSLRDFLLDGKRCKSHDLSIDEREINKNLFNSSLKSMAKHLKKNICNLRLPGSLTSEVDESTVKQCIPSSVQYACRYWVQHLGRSGFEPSDNDIIHAFLNSNFLNWLEAMCLMGKSSDSIFLLRDLESILTSSPHTSFDLRTFVYDAKRFVLKNVFIIKMSPLQIYCSALVFTPTNTTIRRQFGSQIPRWLKGMPVVPESWDPVLQSLEGHIGYVTNVAFSPKLDGQLIASASADGTVRLWDLSTGSMLATLEGHSEWVQCVEFSPASQLLASASADRTVRLWDLSTGSMLATLKGHSEWVRCVAFSPASQLLASASTDRTVRLWDPSTGSMLATLKGHSNIVRCVAFSPSSQLLASASDDMTVRLWDPSTQALCATLSHPNKVKAVAFSPDGQLLASVSDGDVRLWDPSTQALRDTLRHPGVGAVAFSPDGQLLASASEDKIQLRDQSTGAMRTVLEGNLDPYAGLAFSPDSRLLASAQRNVIQLHDISATMCAAPVGHSQLVLSVIFSPDGRTLASTSQDHTVRLWDSSTGTELATLEGHCDYVRAATFSPDGRILASASDDKTVRLWDSPTGTALATLEGHCDYVRAATFSPDGRILASASDDKTVRLWYSSTGTALATLEGHSNYVRAAEFSPDGRIIASTSYDRTVRLWDSSTGAALATLEGHSNWLLAATFSPDGRALASTSLDGTIRLWGRKAGAGRWENLSVHPHSGISFCNDSLPLKTDQGVTKFEGIGPENKDVWYRADKDQLFYPFQLYFSEDWVMVADKKLIWLPPDYRPNPNVNYYIATTIRHNVLAIGSESGRVIFITVDPEMLSPNNWPGIASLGDTV